MNVKPAIRELGHVEEILTDEKRRSNVLEQHMRVCARDRSICALGTTLVNERAACEIRVAQNMGGWRVSADMSAGAGGLNRRLHQHAQMPGGTDDAFDLTDEHSRPFGQHSCGTCRRYPMHGEVAQGADGRIEQSRLR